MPSPRRPGRAPSALAALCLAGIVVSGDARVMSPLLPAIGRDFGVSAGSAGLVVTAYLAPYAACQLLYGPFGDRHGKLWTIRVSLLLFSIATALCAAAPSLVALAVLRGITGLCAAACVPMGLAYLGDTVPYERRQHAIGLLLSAMMVGQATSQALGGVLGSVISWRAIFLVLAATGAVAVAMLWRLPTDPGRRDAHGHLRPYLDVARRGPAFFVAVGVEGALFLGGFTYLGALMRDVHGTSYAVIGVILALYGVGAYGAARATRGRSSVGREHVRLLAGSLVMAAALACGAVLAGDAVPPLVLFAVAAALLGVGFQTAHSTLQTSATEIAPERRGTSLAFFSFSMNTGSALGTALVGVLVDGPGYRTAFVAVAVAMAAFGVLGRGTVRRRTAA